jgi:hypothetical protein
VDDLQRFIDTETPFAFSRWGDGEWRAVCQDHVGKANCDGHQYFRDMGEALGDVLRSRPPYILGFQQWPTKVRRPWCRWLEMEGLTDLKWVEANIFHFSAQKDDWRFREWPNIMVGPKHLRPVFPNARFIVVPDKDCWLQTDAILSELWSLLTDAKTHTVVGYCGSMASNVWVDRMYREFSQDTHIDFGSVFDPLAGVFSRRYMKKAAANGEYATSMGD